MSKKLFFKESKNEMTVTGQPEADKMHIEDSQKKTKTKLRMKKRINNRGRAVETFLSNCCLVRCLDFWIPLPILRDTYSEEPTYDQSMLLI